MAKTEDRQAKGTEKVEDGVGGRKARGSEKLEDGIDRSQARENETIDEVEGCQAPRSEKMESKAARQGDRDELGWFGRVMEEVQKRPMGWPCARQ